MKKRIINLNQEVREKSSNEILEDMADIMRIKDDLEKFWDDVYNGNYTITDEELDTANEVLEKYPNHRL